jgi:Alginate lyase
MTLSIHYRYQALIAGSLLFLVHCSAKSAADRGSDVAAVTSKDGVPGASFDLSNYSLTIPEGDPGKPATIEASELSDYSSDYFYTGPQGEMVFWSPSIGVTTGSSSFTRSELREQMTAGDNNANWLATDFSENSLRATLAVNQASPGSGDIGVGQIHEKDGANKPYVLLSFTNGTLHAKVRTVEDVDTYEDINLGSVELDTSFSYEMKMTSDGTLSLTVNDVTETRTIDPSWMSVPLYFKAGAYCIDKSPGSPSDTDGCKASFSSLERSHQ